MAPDPKELVLLRRIDQRHLAPLFQGSARHKGDLHNYTGKASNMGGGGMAPALSWS
jgi:hypothetical protein